MTPAPPSATLGLRHPRWDNNGDHMAASNRLIAIAVAALLFVCTLSSRCQAAADKAEYELQEQCGRQASEAFERLYGSGFEKTDNGYRITTFENNYDVESNACYMAIKNTEHGTDHKTNTAYDVLSIELRDVNRNRQIGWIVYIKGKPPDAGSCEVANHLCQSPEEWTALAAPYMNW
jgi:hypothetical protein